MTQKEPGHANMGTSHKLMNHVANAKTKAGYAILIFSVFLLVVVTGILIYSSNWVVFFTGLFIFAALVLTGKALVDSGNRMSETIISDMGHKIRGHYSEHSSHQTHEHSRTALVKHMTRAKKQHLKNNKDNFIGHYVKRRQHVSHSTERKHCIICGVKIPPKSKYCPECGESQN